MEKIEALTDRSRKARAALDQIPALLDQFRQSVLAAAFRGDLTADWRAQNPNVEPAEALLERIRVERRDRWEEAELEKMRVKGKELKNNKWKEKYKAIEPIEEELFELPEEWIWVASEEITEPDADIVYGIVQPGPNIPNGIPYVRGKDIQDGRILIDQLLRTSPKIAERYTRASLQNGDVLLGIIRATKVVIVPNELHGANITQGNARFRPSSVILTEYLAGCLENPITQEWLHLHYRGIDMPGLNLADVRRVPIPLAPLEEQKALVKKLAAYDKLYDSIRESLLELFSEAESIDQSILAKAFRGELVPQDPSDEPAAVLLDRIRAQRDTLASQRTPKKSKKN